MQTIAKKIETDIIKDIVEVLFASLFLGLFAKIYIPLFFTPVPIILQNSIAISYGYFLGAKKGAAAVILFILFGLIGLPFFSGGNYSLSYLMQTNGGYILSYAIASFFVGKIFQKNRPTSQKDIAITILFGHLLVLFGGSLWLSAFVGFKKAFLLGVLPFIAVDIFKSIVITKLIKLKNSYI